MGSQLSGSLVMKLLLFPPQRIQSFKHNSQCLKYLGYFHVEALYMQGACVVFMCMLSCLYHHHGEAD